MTGYKFLFTKPQKTKGFTLIELMVVIGIIGILAAIGLSAYSKAQIVGRDSRRKQDLRALQAALELYYQKNGRYPLSTSWEFDATNTSGCTLTDSWLKDNTSPTAVAFDN